MGTSKDGIDLDAREMEVVGKGPKHRVVPLLPVTAAVLAAHINKYPPPRLSCSRTTSGPATPRFSTWRRR